MNSHDFLNRPWFVPFRPLFLKIIGISPPKRFVLVIMITCIKEAAETVHWRVNQEGVYMATMVRIHIPGGGEGSKRGGTGGGVKEGSGGRKKEGRQRSKKGDD